MTLISLPLLGSLVALSQTWERASLLRAPLAVVGVPLALVGYIFVALITSPTREDKMLKLAICDSFPFSHLAAS